MVTGSCGSSVTVSIKAQTMTPRSKRDALYLYTSACNRSSELQSHKIPQQLHAKSLNDIVGTKKNRGLSNSIHELYVLARMELT